MQILVIRVVMTFLFCSLGKLLYRLTTLAQISFPSRDHWSPYAAHPPVFPWPFHFSSLLCVTLKCVLCTLHVHTQLCILSYFFDFLSLRSLVVLLRDVENDLQNHLYNSLRETPLTWHQEACRGSSHNPRSLLVADPTARKKHTLGLTQFWLLYHPVGARHQPSQRVATTLGTS